MTQFKAKKPPSGYKYPKNGPEAVNTEHHMWIKQGQVWPNNVLYNKINKEHISRGK